jgi:hypothetical protein
MELKKYTAKELVEKAGFENVEFGKDRVRIAGIRGIVSPDHKIKINSEEVDVTVGNETKIAK